MRSDRMLAYEFQEDSSKAQMTGHAGLLPYIDLACVLGLLEAVDGNVQVSGSQGWMDRQHVLALALLNLAGGECVEDIRTLEADEGLCRVFSQAEEYGLSRAGRQELSRRFRKGRTRVFPSATRLYEYLNAFHDSSEEAKREDGRAFIPAKNEHLRGLGEVNRALLAALQRHAPEKEATLDIDATLQQTCKREALFCYDGYRAYQPLTVYWAENQTALVSEFRDGNVPAGHEVLRVLKEALAALPAGVEQPRVRMDSAGYQHEVLRFCATGDGGRRSPIEFTVSNDMTGEFRKAAMEVGEDQWQALYRPEGGRQTRPCQEWAEVVYVPNAIAFSKGSPEYRYLAIREELRQGVLPGTEETAGEVDHPFATIVCGARSYRIKGIVTNRAGDGAELVRWHYQRCGKSEEAHAVMKRDLAGGCLPSGKFGANAAWWAMMVLAFNLHAAMRALALPGGLKAKRLKGIRFALIAVPGRVMEHSRRLFIRVRRGHAALPWLLEMRRRIGGLAPCPG